MSGASALEIFPGMPRAKALSTAGRIVEGGASAPAIESDTVRPAAASATSWRLASGMLVLVI